MCFSLLLCRLHHSAKLSMNYGDEEEEDKDSTRNKQRLIPFMILF